MFPYPVTPYAFLKSTCTNLFLKNLVNGDILFSDFSLILTCTVGYLHRWPLTIFAPVQSRWIITAPQPTQTVPLGGVVPCLTTGRPCRPVRPLSIDCQIRKYRCQKQQRGNLAPKNSDKLISVLLSHDYRINTGLFFLPVLFLPFYSCKKFRPIFN